MRLKLMLLKYFIIKYIAANAFTKKLLLIKLFKIKCLLVNLLREIYQLCLTRLYITLNINIHNLDQGLAWE